MCTQWILQTYGDPLTTIRRFLCAIWEQGDLDGLFLPVYQGGGVGITSRLVENPAQLVAADPLVPFVPENSAKLVAHMALDRSDAHIGVALRSCEVRALAEKKMQGYEIPSEWLMIGIDCLCSFPIEDLTWRTQKAGTLEKITRQALRFARQGAIAPYRFRQACQMCITPSCEEVDLNIELIGLPVKEFILISAKNEAISDQFTLSEITTGPAPHTVEAQHDRMIDLLVEHRMRCRDRKILILESELPSQTSEFIELLDSCTPCHQCLEVCPIYSGELAGRDNGNGAVFLEGVNKWLAACVVCGMCEQACPRNLPLTTLHCRLSHEIGHQRLPAVV